MFSYSFVVEVFQNYVQYKPGYIESVEYLFLYKVRMYVMILYEPASWHISQMDVIGAYCSKTCKNLCKRRDDEVFIVPAKIKLNKLVEWKDLVNCDK